MTELWRKKVKRVFVRLSRLQLKVGAAGNIILRHLVFL